VEFQSAQGGVAITSLEPPFAIDGLSVSMTNALGEAVDLSVGTILANGRYSITASYQDFDFNGLPFNGFGFGMTVDAAVPAPGAIALLGLAGLAGRRRR
jgi:MYXO-CTERM domain-containing protein